MIWINDPKVGKVNQGSYSQLKTREVGEPNIGDQAELVRLRLVTPPPRLLLVVITFN